MTRSLTVLDLKSSVMCKAGASRDRKVTRPRAVCVMAAGPVDTVSTPACRAGAERQSRADSVLAPEGLGLSFAGKAVAHLLCLEPVA
jgi:hypothetical protein